MKRYTLVLLLLVCCSTFTYADKKEKKQVKLESINIEYKGETKKGLAHGKGIAKGSTDSYDGEFKKGYPHGFGIYSWGNGNKYLGEFSKGEMEGKGKLIIKREGNLPDSIVEGYFKDNEYIGKYKKPYKILSDANVRSINVQKTLANPHQVAIEIYANGRKVSGSISDQNNSLIERISGKQTLVNVIYPLKRVEVKFRSNGMNYQVIFDIYQEGSWNVVINV